jgi:hypothetical protein
MGLACGGECGRGVQLGRKRERVRRRLGGGGKRGHLSLSHERHPSSSVRESSSSATTTTKTKHSSRLSIDHPHTTHVQAADLSSSKRSNRSDGPLCSCRQQRAWQTRHLEPPSHTHTHTHKLPGTESQRAPTARARSLGLLWSEDRELNPFPSPHTRLTSFFWFCGQTENKQKTNRQTQINHQASIGEKTGALARQRTHNSRWTSSSINRLLLLLQLDAIECMKCSGCGLIDWLIDRMNASEYLYPPQAPPLLDNRIL